MEGEQEKQGGEHGEMEGQGEGEGGHGFLVREGL